MAATQPIETTTRLLTIPEIAERSGYGQRFLRDEVRAGRLRAYRAGKRWLRIREADFADWLESQRVAPAAPDSARDWAEGKIERERLAAWSR
jgi:excisionase family DNA binding protein